MSERRRRFSPQFIPERAVPVKHSSRVVIFLVVFSAWFRACGDEASRSGIGRRPTAGRP
jgi:hypothetical protein